ncbi:MULTISPECIES: sigma-E processing peptidase SpoIIGA [Rummeliibacillus]|uniref:Uncharacterized protein n=1 Tax=Rummeliibacillus stabekisii TaxID=241244 RepID=A0A143HA38_9BACL|nr:MULTISPECIES: sigma-E processing peptidase SpoIIGA [Rummeliibacillus]AMW98345.1 hypothetical protein ATY39_02225 [Rummeliibacillus stabekisii]MBB5169963.1 stage II sporulation protein GA (sporulation sigma-E factor processing peptidase) [Rummeliibacillus stabekisii]GEL04221.1 hypothetical protein RST01_08480 [Rummeliibacillus stabekisii]
MYGEVLILINAIFNYVILSFTNSICYMGKKKIRLMGSALFAGAWIVIFGHQFLMMVVAFLLMMILAFGFHIRQLWKTALMCFIAALFAGGLFTALEPLLIGRSVIILMLIAGVVASFSLFILKSRLFAFTGDRLQQQLVQWCKVQLGEIDVSLKCFIDTGNTTVEPLSGRPVHFVRYQAIEQSMPEHLKIALHNWDVNDPYNLDMFPNEYKKKVAVIPITTVQEKKTYSLALKYDQWQIIKGKHHSIAPGFLIITLQNTHFPQETDAILHFTALSRVGSI